MAGAGNSAYHQWSTAPGNCPSQYVRLQPSEVTPYYTCDYSGAVTVVIDGAQWTRTWWTIGGGQTVTEYSPVAKARFGTWDTRFEDEYAAWLAVQQRQVCVDC